MGEEGVGEVLLATDEARTLKVQFRSNKKKTAGGFRCQIAAYAQITGSGSGSGAVNGTGSGASCTTIDGPAAGSACAFPFDYMGVSHFGCTTIDGDPTPWCSTQTDANDNHVSGIGAWGYCDASCPVQETAATTTAAPATTAAPGPVVTAAPGTCQCGVKGGAANGRIVGGQETEEHEYPWQVGLVSRNGRTPWCGGTLISSTHVLTAAHCTQTSASSIRVILGEHSIADSDFAILRLSSPVAFTNEVSPACLPADLSATYAGVLATVTGWGTLSSGGNQPTALQEVDVTVTTNAVCNQAYGSITANMNCAADSGKDSCQGDSGGPLIAPENGRQALIGVVSWGRGCAFDGWPGVYARVTEKMDWILANTAGTFSSTCTALN